MSRNARKKWKKEKRALINESTTKITRIIILYIYPDYYSSNFHGKFHLDKRQRGEFSFLKSKITHSIISMYSNYYYNGHPRKGYLFYISCSHGNKQ